MTAYITIAVGPDLDRAEPVLVSDDPRIVRAAVEALLDQIDGLRRRPSLEPSDLA